MSDVLELRQTKIVREPGLEELERGEREVAGEGGGEGEGEVGIGYAGDLEPEGEEERVKERGRVPGAELVRVRFAISEFFLRSLDKRRSLRLFFERNLVPDLLKERAAAASSGS